MDETTNTEAEQSSRRARTAGGADGVVFAVKPRIVVKDDGVYVSCALSYRGVGTINVGVRLSVKGRMIDVDLPSVALEAAAGPTRLQIELPLDAGIKKGAKVTVAVVDSSGNAVAVNSTGALTVKLPGERSITLSGSQVAVAGVVGVVGALSIGGVIAARWPDPSPPESTVSEVVEDEPAEEPAAEEPAEEPTEEPVVEVVESALWPLDVPEVMLVSLVEPSSEGSVEPYEIKVRSPLEVELEAVESTTDGRRYRLTARFEDLRELAGIVELPAELPPEEVGGRLELAAATAGASPVSDGSLTSLYCHPEGDRKTRLGDYVIDGDAGELTVRLFARATEAGQFGLEVDAVLMSSIRLEKQDPAAVIDESRCPPTPTGRVTWSSNPEVAASAVESNSDEGEASPTDDGSTDAGGSDEISADSTSGFGAEPLEGLLRRGHEGERVRALQAALVEAGFLDATGVDGAFGPRTEQAVAEFQRVEGLDIDGLAGPGTHDALGLPYPEIGSGEVDYRPEPSSGPLSLGHVGERVRALQVALVGLDRYEGVVDGEFGPSTRAAVRDAQLALGLDGDDEVVLGVAGRATHEALGLEFN